MGSGPVLKVAYFGKTSFALETKETTVLLNPGTWDGESVVPDDFDCRVIIVTNHEDDALGNAAEIAVNSKAWILGNESTIERAKEQGAKAWLLHILKPEVPYEIPGLKVTPFPLQKRSVETNVMIVPVGGEHAFPVKDAVSLCIDALPQVGIPVRWTSEDQPKKFAKYIEQFGQKTTPLLMEPGQTLEVQWAAGHEFRHSVSSASPEPE
jgi:hypothetical protein